MYPPYSQSGPAGLKQPSPETSMGAGVPGSFSLASGHPSSGGRGPFTTSGLQPIVTAVPQSHPLLVPQPSSQSIDFAMSGHASSAMGASRSQRPLEAHDTNGNLADPGVSSNSVSVTVRSGLPPSPPRTTSGAGAPSHTVSPTPLDAHHQRLRQESLLLWRKPQQQVVFREWYIYHYCNEENVRLLDRIQRFCFPFRKLITLYFKMWSLTGEAEFYTVFIPTLAWLGTPLDAFRIGSMLCMSQYVTGTLKDAMCCPRPPCPPLELRGSRETHDKEYGFPSTHSSHSSVFAYFLYSELILFFPNHVFLCWCVAVFYWVNVCLSRLYLGMHWVGDLIGGWVVAFMCVLFHVSFVDHWEEAVLTADVSPWVLWLAGYVVLHILSMSHATPHDPCPCYVDSLRFSGVMVGATIGMSTFRSQYGTITARPKPADLFNELVSWAFFKQWLLCIVITVVAKEGSSLVASKILKVTFKFLSGAYVGSVPRPLKRVYLQLARLVGRTTRGNERGGVRYYPITANSSFNGPALATTNFNRGLPDATGASAHTQPPPSASPQPSVSSPNTRVTDNGMVEEPDGYLHHQQVWSLRTHEHWWLWDVHRRTVSYFVTGLVVTYVCAVLLREYFEVGKGVSLTLFSPPVLSPDGAAVPAS